LGWLPRYPREWLRFDLVAGLTAAAVVIPQAMAYASLAGLPVEVGLYTALVPMLVYALLGTSRPLSVSATSTIAMLTATALGAVVQSSNPYDYVIPAATLAFLVGVFLALAAVLRLGFIANFISIPVLTGFKAGIGAGHFGGQGASPPADCGHSEQSGRSSRAHGRDIAHYFGYSDPASPLLAASLRAAGSRGLWHPGLCALELG
jgi:MFS superfamily sulfate permease-like transporter